MEELVSDWDVIVPFKDIKILKTLGSGSYGVVSMAKCRGQTVAVKKLKRQELDAAKLDELKKEIDIMRRLKSNQIVLLMGLCEEPDNISIIMEFVSGRNLFDIIHDPHTPLSMEQKLRISKDIAVGCNWLHRLNPPVVHRDLKPDNVMVSADLKQVKLCDFGLSCIKQTEDLKTVVGSPIYMSPERFYGAPGDEKSDVYGYGLTIWELWERGDRPFCDVESFDALVDEVDRKGVRPSFNATPEPVAKLIRACWHQDPAQRPGFEQVLTLIDLITVDTLISDPRGRDLWKKAQGKDVGFPFEMSWPLFESLLDEAIKWESKEEEVFKCLKAQIAEEVVDLTRGEKRFVATCDKFGSFLEIFGPLRYKSIFGFAQVCSRLYYHGDIDSGTAKARLAQAEPGAFLVRMSSNERNCLTLSKKEKKGGVSHQRIMKTPDKGYVINLGTEMAAFRSLKQLVARCKKPLGLTECCATGSKFAAIWDSEFDETENTDNYIKPLSAAALLALAEKSKKLKEKKKKTKKKKSSVKGN